MNSAAATIPRFIHDLLHCDALLQGVIATVLGLGTLNRVLYRLALVPLKDYVFFLAQAQNIGYILIYYALLAIRFRSADNCLLQWSPQHAACASVKEQLAQTNGTKP